MRLRFTPEAARELDEVLTSITEHSPQGARRVQARIQKAVELLADHPRGGQITSHSRLRRITTSPYPYVVFYEVGESEVVVISVRHAARDRDPRTG